MEFSQIKIECDCECAVCMTSILLFKLFFFFFSGLTIYPHSKAQSHILKELVLS